MYPALTLLFAFATATHDIAWPSPNTNWSILQGHYVMERKGMVFYCREDFFRAWVYLFPGDNPCRLELSVAGIPYHELYDERLVHTECNSCFMIVGGGNCTTRMSMQVDYETCQQSTVPTPVFDMQTVDQGQTIALYVMGSVLGVCILMILMVCCCVLRNPKPAPPPERPTFRPPTYGMYLPPPPFSVINLDGGM